MGEVKPRVGDEHVDGGEMAGGGDRLRHAHDPQRLLGPRVWIGGAGRDRVRRRNPDGGSAGEGQQQVSRR